MPKAGYWTEQAAPIIRAVLQATRGQPEPVIRRALQAAYPFGKRSPYPWQAWCAEIERQREELAAHPELVDERQLTLFEEE